MKKETDTKIPEFQSLEEEREYWESRGPLAKGHKGQVSKPEVSEKRSSFLSVRLTGQELTQLRDLAVRIGVPPSTFARYALKLAIEQFNLDRPESGYSDPTFPKRLYESTHEVVIPPNIGVLSPKEIEFNKILSQEMLHKLMQLCDLCGFRFICHEDVPGFITSHSKGPEHAEKIQP